MIIFINGSINSGKSTVSKLLAQKIENTALLEIDSLSEFIDWLPIDKKVDINLENTVLLIKNFIKKGFNIIVPYPLSEKNYKYFIAKLKNEKNIFFFTLSPDLKVVLKDRGKRKLTNWEKERIKYHYKIGINNPNFGTVINNSDQDPKETADIILKSIPNNLWQILLK